MISIMNMTSGRNGLNNVLVAAGVVSLVILVYKQSTWTAAGKHNYKTPLLTDQAVKKKTLQMKDEVYNRLLIPNTFAFRMKGKHSLTGGEGKSGIPHDVPVTDYDDMTDFQTDTTGESMTSTTVTSTTITASTLTTLTTSTATSLISTSSSPTLSTTTDTGDLPTALKSRISDHNVPSVLNVGATVDRPNNMHGIASSIMTKHNMNNSKRIIDKLKNKGKLRTGQ